MVSWTFRIGFLQFLVMQNVGFGLVQEDSLGRSMFKLDA